MMKFRSLDLQKCERRVSSLLNKKQMGSAQYEAVQQKILELEEEVQRVYPK